MLKFTGSRNIYTASTSYCLNSHISTAKQYCILIPIAFLGRKELEFAKADCILETSKLLSNSPQLFIFFSTHSHFSALDGTVCILVYVCQADDNKISLEVQRQSD